MSTVQESVDVQVPVRTAYNQWTQFEDFPQFMEGVESVTQESDRRLRWVADVGGVRREWEAQISEQIPDQRIAWTSRQGAHNAGAVTFLPLDEELTRIMLELDFAPEEVVEETGDKLGFLKRQVKGDLRRFKDFIESRGSETGSWRGRIQNN